MPHKKKISYSNFLKRIKDTSDRYDMLKKGDRVLVCVSGGADSVCLLAVLHLLAKKMSFEIIAANMDHCLRAEESEKDSEFVKELCRGKNIVCVHKKTDVLSGGKKRVSLEEKARRERYKFFHKAAKEYGCNVIATGHNMDDQAENVIMKVVYGGSIQGLSGIPPVREEKECLIVRPLIRVSREEILYFLKKIKQDFVEDSSNRDISFPRNRVRIELLPLLETYNPSIRRTLVNISDTLREDIEFIEQNRVKTGPGNDGSCRIDIKDIVLQPKALRKDIFRQMLINAGGNVKKLTYRHWMDMDSFLSSAEKGKSIDLPGGIKVVKTRRTLIFEKKS